MRSVLPTSLCFTANDCVRVKIKETFHHIENLLSRIIMLDEDSADMSETDLHAIHQRKDDIKLQNANNRMGGS